MKRILFILHTPPPIHGPAKVGLYIKESELINSTFSSRYINLSTSRSVDEIGKNPLIKTGRYLSILWQTLWQLLVFRPQQVYLTISASGAGFYKDFPVAMLAGIFGAKRIYHFHNKGIRERQDKWLDNLLCRLIFSNAEVILLSKYLYNDISKYVPEESVKYCANGVEELEVGSGELVANRVEELEVGSSELVTNRENNNNPITSNYQLSTINSQLPTILFLSNLIVSKGVYILLDACKLLQQKGLLFNCTLVGSEGDITAEQLNQKLKDMQLSDIVKYAGKQYGNDKEEFWNKADIFVHPTFNDCFPLVLLEAMQHSLPVVSTMEGAIPEIVTENKTGFLVTPGDVTALADKLELMISSQELRKNMGEEGRLKYEQEYTLRKFEERMVKIMIND